MTDEQRKHVRPPLLFEVLWEGLTGKSTARTMDINVGGCFIDTVADEVAIGESVQVKLGLPNGEWIVVQGEVVYRLPHTGFGVRFTNISDEDRKRIEAFVKSGD